jgi:hypothetical protein
VISFRPKNIAGTGATLACAFLLCGLFIQELDIVGSLLYGLILLGTMATLSGVLFCIFLLFCLGCSGIGILIFIAPAFFLFSLISRMEQKIQG